MRTIRFAGLISLSAALCAQAPRFEVASVKPTPPDQYNGSSGIASGHGRIDGERVTLLRCILGAYHVSPRQVIGGPPWLDTDRFEIAAKADHRTEDDEELMIMLRALLAERFQLALHRETRTMDALVLEVVKNGPKLEKSSGTGANSNTSGSHGALNATDTPMATLAEVLSRTIGSPVVNGTNLDGAYNFKLTWNPEADRPLKPGEAPADNGPNLFTALQQQLGLRLQARKLPVEVLVIDRAEKPAAN